MVVQCPRLRVAAVSRLPRITKYQLTHVESLGEPCVGEGWITWLQVGRRVGVVHKSPQAPLLSCRSRHCAIGVSGFACKLM